ncbi:MAG TPA: oligopeptide transporter, OPT family [Gemmatimonadales bacterium]
MAASTGQPFKPFVPDSENKAEFTVRAVILGVIFGLIFGAATVYLALTAGLTVSASIPIAVLSIAVFRKLGNSTILENNIVQTIGSASESLAAGVVFTLPALIFLSSGTGQPEYFTYFNIFTLAMIGGVIGVLFMVPLRRALIVKEHGELPYPEGTACAEVLMAGERGGSLAAKVFAGLGIATSYKFLMELLGLWKKTPTFVSSHTGALPSATIAADVTPEYLGVGYIIGPKIAGLLFGGGVLSYLVLIPLVSIIGDHLPTVLKPGVGNTLISQMSPGEIRLGYVRYIGAGAVAAAGLITLIKTLPTIVSAFSSSFASLKDLRAGKTLARTERDMPITWVLVGSVILIAVVAMLPQLPGTGLGRLAMGAMVVVFGFFFVTVSSRITGLIGNSSNPISGMAIATLMATCLIFVSLGWTTQLHQSLALVVGGMVCIAAAEAGATSQDLKTGYIVGATPIYQQIGLVIGVVTSTFAIGWTLQVLDHSMAFQGVQHAIGTEKLAAPQATLMATIIQGMIGRNLPWALVFVGACISVVMEIAGVRSLPFAVGSYLPISTTAPIFVGGLMRALAEKMSGRKEDSEVSSGMLYATGLVAGGALTGVLIAAVSGIPITVNGQQESVITWIWDKVGVKEWASLGGGADIISVVLFAGLCFMLVKAGREKMA